MQSGERGRSVYIYCHLNLLKMRIHFSAIVIQICSQHSIKVCTLFRGFRSICALRLKLIKKHNPGDDHTEFIAHSINLV